MDSRIELGLKAIQTRIDSRYIAFNLKVKKEGDGFKISGVVHNPRLITAVKRELKKTAKGAKVKYDIDVIQNSGAPSFAQIRVPVAPMIREPQAGTEQLSQEVTGRMVRTYHENGKYIFAQLSDGYLGWLEKDHVIEKSAKEYLRWVTGRKAILTQHVDRKNLKLPLGAELSLRPNNEIVLPNGSTAKIPANGYTVSHPSKNPTRARIIKAAKTLQTVRYLWGGKSRNGMDCSGFTQLMYEIQGLLIPRDASQQVSVGRLVGHLPDYSDILPGDLVFFMDEKAKVYHVGLSLGGSKFIHASFVKKGVILDDLNATDPERHEKYYSKYLFAKSILM